MIGKNVDQADFNSYGSRRGNHEVMMRGTFANIRIKNEMVPGIEGGYTKHIATGTQLSIYDASISTKRQKLHLLLLRAKNMVPAHLVIGQLGDKSTWVKAVICESYERIHRSNLIGMGVIPLQFIGGENRKTLGTLLEVREISITPTGPLAPQMEFEVLISTEDGETKTTKVQSRIDTEDELNYFKNGGILQYVIRRLNRVSLYSPWPFFYRVKKLSFLVE